jgi:protein TonB
MRNPVTIPAALLFNESLVITRPAARLRSGWMGLSVGLHLLAGGAFLVAPLFQIEKLEPPVIQPLIRIPVLLGGYTPAGPKGDPHGSTVKPPDHKMEPIKKLEIPVSAVTPPSPSDPHLEGKIPDENGSTGLPFGDKDGTDGGTGKPGDKGSGIPGMPLGKGDGPDTGVQEIVRAYNLTDPPVLISHEEPVYPETARSQGVEGNVYLELVVDEYGRVIDARILRSDNAMFNASALASVKRWKYTAARADGRAVRTYKTVTMRFTLH